MHLLLPLAAIVLSIAGAITPGADAKISVESFCHSNRRYKNAAASCVLDLINKKLEVADNAWCICSAVGITREKVANALYHEVNDAPCRFGSAIDEQSNKIGSFVSTAMVTCMGLDSISHPIFTVPRPSKPEGGVLVTQFLLSESGEFSAVLQSDGNVIVKRRGQVFWYITDVPRSDGPFTAVMNRDGRFCVLNGKVKPVICTPSRGGLADYLIQLGDDGNLCVRGPNPWCTGKHI